MIALTKVVENYYNERKLQKCNLFRKNKTPLKVSIHTVINLNSTSKRNYSDRKDDIRINNDIVLLKLMIKNSKRSNKPLSEVFSEFKFDSKHHRRFFNFKKISEKLGNNLKEDAHYQKIKKTFLPYEYAKFLHEKELAEFIPTKEEKESLIQRLKKGFFK